MDARSHVLKIDIPLHWTLVLVKGSRFNWHKDLPKTVLARDMLTGPKIYRWVLRGGTNEILAVYIGQSERFEERMSEYRSGNGNGLDPEDSVRAALTDGFASQQTKGMKPHVRTLKSTASPNEVHTWDSLRAFRRRFLSKSAQRKLAPQSCSAYSTSTSGGVLSS
jgi:hypothetical protein